MEQFSTTSDGHMPSEIVISEGKLAFFDQLCPLEMRVIVVVYVVYFRRYPVATLAGDAR